MRLVSVLLVSLLVVSAGLPVAGVVAESAAPTTDGAKNPIAGTNATTPDHASILELYPNPVVQGNRGEYLVVDLPRPGNWSLWDGHHSASLPPDAVGTVALAMDPNNASRHVDRRVYRVDYFPLSARGDRIELRYEGRTVHVVAYDEAKEADVWHRDTGWEPYGYEAFDPESRNTATDVTTTAFVLPDNTGPPLAPLLEADERIRLAGYTLGSERVARALVDAHERGVSVSVLVEGTPVGGFPQSTAKVLDRLHDVGIEVRVLAGPRSRFAFHHAKYAVADDRAVVLTENWKPAGTGGAGSRGWGLTVDDAALAADLARLFEQDSTAIDAKAWPVVRANTTVRSSSPADEQFPTRFSPITAEAERVELLVVPEGATDRLVSTIDDADDRVFVIVPRAGDESTLLGAVLRAADRGVESRVLLSNAWYDAEENAELARKLNDRAAAREVPLTVTVAEPRSRYGKIHAKGVVVDDTVIVGSLNWNRQATERNREVLLAVEGSKAADYFARVYAADWRGGGVHLPVSLLGGAGVTLVAAGLLARRKVTFV